MTIKTPSKPCITDPLWEEFIGERRVPVDSPHKGPRNAESVYAPWSHPEPEYSNERQQK